MPRDPFLPGTGPQAAHRGLRLTVRAPSTVSSTAPILPGQPLRWGRTSPTTGAVSTTGLGGTAAICAVDEVPELISMQRVETPYMDFAVAVLKPSMAVNDPGTGTFVEQIPYTGTPITGTNLGVIADGANGVKIVAAANGVGRVIRILGTECEVLF